MLLPDNAFKRALVDRRRLIGLWSALADPYCVELCAQADFDWMLLDGEHGPNDLRGILAQLQALAPYRSAPVVRVPHGDANLLKQYLEIGAQNILVPMVDSPEQAAAAVAATRYPPQGIRGVGSSIARSSRWGSYTNYLHAANERICLIVQVETAAGAARAAEIAAVEGVDGVFVGPADLAASMGRLGDAAHHEVQAVVEQVMRAVIGLGKPVGTLTADPHMIRRYLDLGASFVAVGVDATLLGRAVRDLAAAWMAPQA